MYRSFLLLIFFFSTCISGVAQVSATGIQITEEMYEGVSHYKITTPTAVYYYDRAGGGFSRMIDREGKDWIAFKREPWDQYPASAASAYRGIPNLVFGSHDAGAGHPGHDQCVSEVVNGHTIVTRSLSEAWQWRWTFYEEFAMLTVLQVAEDHPYWFLYEGTPGGVFEPGAQYFGADTGGPRLDTPDYLAGEKIFQNWQWAYFGHQNADRVLFIAQEQPDTLSDTFAYLGATDAGKAAEDGMIVFGFGRADNAQPLMTRPNTFFLGFREGKIQNRGAHRKLAQYIDRLMMPPTGLLTELLREPEKAVITDRTPEFGWIFPQKGIAQKAYRIRVASSPELLMAGRPDLWDSGEVKSDSSQNVSYSGRPLQPNQSYWWQVKVWGEKGMVSPYSVMQRFRTGSFDRSEDEWPGESQWVRTDEPEWVAEDRQKASFHEVTPRRLKPTRPGRYFVDFGRAAFGTLELTAVAAREGEMLELFLGERKNDDLTVNKEPGVSNIGFQRIELPLKKGRHNYKVEIPSHRARYPHSQKLASFYPEVMPFRYVEMIGPAGFELENIHQLALFYYFDEEASSFSSSDQRLNDVWDLCKYTLKATPFLGLYADGNRERMPYEADAYIQQLGHYSVDREFSVARYTANFLLYHAAWPTEWQMHTLLMAWADYLHTGDEEFLAKHYDDLKAKSLVDLAREDGLISTRTGKATPKFLESLHFNGNNFRDIVDWPAGTEPGQKQASNRGPTPEGERDGYVFTDINTVVNAFHYRSLVIMEQIAAILEKKNDRAFFKDQAAKVKAAIQEKLFDPQRGVFTDGEGTDHASLHANMFPLAFGLVSEEYRPTVVEHLKSRGMACSVYGAQYLLEALYEAGAADYALGLMTSDSRRSWLNMIRVGSTMTTEAWDEYYKPNLTWNHAWGAAPANIIPRKLLGIEPLEPAYRRFRICPQPGDLQEADLRLPTIRGAIHCTLQNEGSSWQMEISVPGNSEAELLLPARFSEILVDAEPVKRTRIVSAAGGDRRRIILKSGTYQVAARE